MQNEIHRIRLIKEYEAAPDDTYFKQATVAALRNCSIATVERDRWAGTGVPFVKFNRAVRYRKSDIRDWLSKYPVVRSTSEISVLSKSRQL